MTEILIERLFNNDANIKLESLEGPNKEKTYFMEGIFIQGEVQNHNGRVYPKSEISKAVESLNERLEAGQSILGEVDHPSNLQINLDRVSHMITEMKMDGNNGIGKLKIIPTDMGLLVKTFLENGVKLGVSSRGTGEVDHRGIVKNFEIITVDIVAQPSAPEAYPQTIIEAMERYKRLNALSDLAKSSEYDPKAQKYLLKEIHKFFNTNLKLH